EAQSQRTTTHSQQAVTSAGQSSKESSSQPGSSELSSVDVSSLTYAQLRARAKELGIPAKGKIEELREAVRAAQTDRIAAAETSPAPLSQPPRTDQPVSAQSSEA